MLKLVMGDESHQYLLVLSLGYLAVHHFHWALFRGSLSRYMSILFL